MASFFPTGPFHLIFAIVYFFPVLLFGRMNSLSSSICWAEYSSHVTPEACNLIHATEEIYLRVRGQKSDGKKMFYDCRAFFFCWRNRFNSPESSIFIVFQPFFWSIGKIVSMDIFIHSVSTFRLSEMAVKKTLQFLR